MAGWLTAQRRSLASAPSTLPALAALVVFGLWASEQAGYFTTQWLPGALLLGALLIVSALTLPGALRDVPAATRVALAGLAAFAAWSYASIAWASAKGVAWDGANRTLLYFVVFALFALWAQRSGTAALVLAGWAATVIGIAVVVLARLPHPVGGAPLLIGGRLAQPAGYPNAEAAQWMMVAWPALILAGRRQTPWWVRGALAGGVVVLVDLTLLTGSRGAVYATPIVLALLFALMPGRVRSLVVLAPIAAAIGATAPRILHVANQVQDFVRPAAALATVRATIGLTAVAVAVAVALVAALETSRPPAPALRDRAHRAVGALGLAGAVGVVVAALVLGGDPATRVRSAWRSFKAGSAPAATGSRLSGGLGSGRYDFYRVALDSFAAHPLVGVGADNYAEDYLARRRTSLMPAYPHSLELRALAETGVVGAVALAIGLGGALAGAWRATRRGQPFAAAVAAGGLMAFVYWLVHGSLDWFWEFAGLGAPAFAMLGLACALGPRGRAAAVASRPIVRGRVAVAGTLGLALVAAGSLGGPWLAQRDVDRAAGTWRVDSVAAFRDLDLAARLNPVSDTAAVTAGSIALRVGQLRRAEREFRAALARDPRDAYAALELGAILSHHSGGARTRETLLRAVRLDPRDELARAALKRSRAGHPVDIVALNRAILGNSNALTR